MKSPAVIASESVVEHLALLHRVSALVSSSVPLKNMLDELVRIIVEVTDSNACLVYLLEPALSEIVLCASQLRHR